MSHVLYVCSRLCCKQADLLSQHVRVARAAGVPIVLVHDEASCDFETIIEMTPDDLVTGGLFQKQVAVPRGEHRLERAASRVLLLRALHKLPTPSRARRSSSVVSVGVGSTDGSSFDLASLFGAGPGAATGSQQQTGGEHGGRQRSRGGSLASVAKRRSLGSLNASPRRLSNAQHAANLQALTMVPPPAAAHHAHVLQLANRRRRLSAFGKLAGSCGSSWTAAAPTSAGVHALTSQASGSCKLLVGAGPGAGAGAIKEVQALSNGVVPDRSTVRVELSA